MIHWAWALLSWGCGVGVGAIGLLAVACVLVGAIQMGGY